jgi:hypothetical protein
MVVFWRMPTVDTSSCVDAFAFEGFRDTFFCPARVFLSSGTVLSCLENTVQDMVFLLQADGSGILRGNLGVWTKNRP